MEDLDAVRDFARRFNATHDRLDVLIHNAGAMHPQFRTDAAGTELKPRREAGRHRLTRPAASPAWAVRRAAAHAAPGEGVTGP